MGDQGVQQMQQPVVVYPNSYSKQYPNLSSSSGSHGSFGTVFIVLAVILVLSALACVFGSLCNRESRAAKQQQHSKHPKHEKGSSKKSREIRPVVREPRERGDLEFGFDKKLPDLIKKPSGRDDGEDIEFGFDNMRGERGGEGSPPSGIKHGVRFKFQENGDQHAKGEIRQGGPEFEYRTGH